jgi:uncharacterized repeat protein (TIGR01451 family)
MQLTKLFIILVILVSFSSVHAVCTGQTTEQYPGWEARFNGSLGVGDLVKNEFYFDIGMDKLRLEVLDIFSGQIANIRISKEGVFEEDFSVTKSSKNFDISLEEIRVKVLGVNETNINLTIFTHDQAIVTEIPVITYKSTEFGGSLPGEIVELELTILNIGELEAKNFQVVEEFVDFEIINKETTQPTSFCSNSSFKIDYELMAPSDLRNDTTYILFIGFSYSYDNTQLITSATRSKTLPIEILIKPTKVEVFKETGFWTLLNQGREVTIFNTVNNSGNRTAYNVNLIDTPPSDFEVIYGQPSLNLGTMDPGKRRKVTYTVISNDPIYCVSSSKLTYEDKEGNRYTSTSERQGIRFSPFVTVEKTVRDSELSPLLGYEWPIKTRRSMKSNYTDIKPASVNFTADAIMKTFDGVPYWSLCQGSFLNDLTDDDDDEVCIDNDDNEPKILINRTAEITVQLKNAGNTIARDIFSIERFKNINYSGDISWNGTLAPGETSSYTYVAEPLEKGRAIDITTEVSYLDVNPLSLPNQEIEGYNVGVCTKKLDNITFSSSGNYSYTYPDLKIEAPTEITVFEDSIFDFLPIVYNNGTEILLNLQILLDFGDLALIKGQRISAIEELGRGFKPFRDETCNIEEWNNENIRWPFRFSEVSTGLIGTLKKNIIYEILNGNLNVVVDGTRTSIKGDCDDTGLEIEHDVSIFNRYPYHVQPEPSDTSKTTKEISFKFYGNPDQQDLAFLTPTVVNETHIPLVTTVVYEDFFGNIFERRFTTDVIVFPSTATFAIVRREKTDLAVLINYTNVTNLEEPGQLNFELSSTGYAPINRYVLNISLPQSIEIATNDSNWTGRIDAEIRRENDTLLIFSGPISRKGNITRDGSVLLPLIIRGQRSGTFNLSYKITYDEKELEGILDFNVKGPSLSVSKELSRNSVNTGEEISVTVKVRNYGDGDALNVIVSDGIPGSALLVGGSTQTTKDVLIPGDALTLNYRVKVTSSANMGGTKVSWQDILGNPYSHDLEPRPIEVIIPSPTPSPETTKTPSPTIETPSPTPSKGRLTPTETLIEKEGIEMSSREGIGAIALTLIVLAIVIKLITIKVPAKEEE